MDLENSDLPEEVKNLVLASRKKPTIRRFLENYAMGNYLNGNREIIVYSEERIEYAGRWAFWIGTKNEKLGIYEGIPGGLLIKEVRNKESALERTEIVVENLIQIANDRYNAKIDSLPISLNVPGKVGQVL